MNRLVRAALRLTSPLHRHLDTLAGRWVGGGTLLACVAHFYGRGNGWTPAQIREQLVRIRERCRFLGLSEAWRRLQAGTLPPRAALLFVDDGTDTFWEAGYPILRELEIPFALSVIPGLIAADDPTHALARLMRVAGQEYERTPERLAAAWRRVTGVEAPIADHASFFDLARKAPLDLLRDLTDVLELPDDRFISWEQLAAMLADSRAELANHSMSHPLMRRVHGDWLDFELVESKRRIEERTGVAVQDFVFPVGAADDATPAVVECLRRSGYRAAWLVGMGVVRDGARFLLPRSPLEVPPALVDVATSHAANAIAGRLAG